MSDPAEYMRLAIDLASRGWGRVSPNPLVGAVLVRDGGIVGEGWHREYGLAHAEVEAIRAAGDLAKGATLYVTLEPCAHTGRTGPCTDAIIEAGIRRVVYASPDPNPVAEGGAEKLASQGVEVVGGVEDSAARLINRPFFRAFEPGSNATPWVELKLALTLDGKIADAQGRSAWISGPPARDEVHRLRAGADAIAIGVGTAIADDPSLTVRGSISPRVPPVRIVFDRDLRLPIGARLVNSARETPVWVACEPGAPQVARRRLEAAGLRIFEADSLASALNAFAAAGIRAMLCEGGAGLSSALLAANLVDRLTLVFAPVMLGPGALDPFIGLPSPPLADARRWRHVRTAVLGTDTLISVER